MSQIRKIDKIEPAYPFAAYAHIISPLPEDEGGGFLITIPDLPGCMSDGETEEEAIANGRDAFASWVSARHDAGKEVSPPSYRPESIPAVSGRFVTRLPKSTHAKLSERARAEGVSLNALVLAMIAEGLGRRETQV
jgi:antitoxin HicB